MIIEGLFVRNPVELIFRIISCFQKWDVLLRAADRKTLDVQKLQVAAWVDSSLQVPKDSYNSFHVICFLYSPMFLETVVKSVYRLFLFARTSMVVLTFLETVFRNCYKDMNSSSTAM